MRVLLDTSIVIEFWKQNVSVTAQVAALATDGLYISAITEGELLAGALNKRDLQIIQRALANLTVIPLTPACGLIMAQLLATYSLSHRLALPDALIAATALHHGLPLFTLNKKDFRYIADLTLYEPS